MKFRPKREHTLEGPQTSTELTTTVECHILLASVRIAEAGKLYFWIRAGVLPRFENESQQSGSSLNSRMCAAKYEKQAANLSNAAE